MAVVATAGHVDHGKSTLVQALTDRDPDRWAEEKERGLTIDLGFAWTEINGMPVGFVDVPGHERFIKNMLAGVGAVDVALFVVAADEGWMPQSEEHLAVLDLLDIRHGVIALTRVDLVDGELAELAELEVLEAVAGTTLEGWPIVRVAAPLGVGVTELKEALGGALASAGPSPNRNRPRLWIDRSFVIKGAGLVVTGTLTDGAVAEGDELTLWPGEVGVRIRGLQSHEAPVPCLEPGSRAAVNLVGAARATVRRGAMLGPRAAFGTTSELLVSLRPVRSLAAPLSARGAFHLHLGSGSWPVRIRLLGDGELTAGDPALIRIREAIPVRSGDRFILREVGRRAVVAGGRILDPRPSGSGEQLRIAAAALTPAIEAGPDQIATRLLQIRRVETFVTLDQDSGGGRPEPALHAGSHAIDPAAAKQMTTGIVTEVGAFHRDHPLRPGIPRARLASTLGLTGELVDALVNADGRLAADGATARLNDFSPGLDPEQEAAWQLARARLAADLAVPRAGALDLDIELLHSLIREGRLVKVDDDLVYLPEQIDSITAALNSLPAGFTVAEFRDALGLTRRQAIPLLEWLDARGWTQRRGDGRVVKRPPESTDDARSR